MDISPWLEAVVLAVAISVDAFVCAFAYGNSRIRLPLRSVATITLVCVVVLGFAMLAGELLRGFFPTSVADVVFFVVLVVIGCSRLVDGLTKRLIMKYAAQALVRQINFRAWGFSFILQLYADPVHADIDESKTISAKEAVSLAAALSLDSVAVGIAAAMTRVDAAMLMTATAVATAVSLLLGVFAGVQLARRMRVDASMLGGILLIILAFMRLFS